MQCLLFQTAIIVVFLLLFAWILDSRGHIRIDHVESGLEADGIAEAKRLSTDQYASTNEIPFVFQAKSQISVYDYQAKKLSIYKSISEMSFVRLMGSEMIVARERIRVDVSGFSIYANPLLSLKTNDKDTKLRLKLWIGLNEEELIQFLEAFDYVKMEKKVLNDLVFLKAF